MRTIGVLSLMALTTLGGCATVGRELTEAGEVSVQRSTSKLVNIQAVSVRQDGEQLVVTGVVRRVPSKNTPIRGHVNVAVIDDTGQMIAHAAVGYSPPSLPHNGPRSSHFIARLAVQAAPGFQVLIEHHDGGHSREECPPLRQLQG